MNLNTPSWFLKTTFVAFALWPVSLIYALFAKVIFGMRKMRQKRAEIPVICVGGLMAGGVGKTPVARKLAHYFDGSVIMTRGYGGKKSGLVSKSDTAAHVGDEAKMLSSDTPVITGRDRVASAAAAGKMGYKRIIMDDGFQNPTLCKDLSILIFDEKLGIGNGFGIPAGPMRESLTSGIKRCDAVIVIRQNASAKTFFKIPKTANRLKKPVFYSKAKNIDPGLRGRVLAFAGTGYPQKFFDGLREFLKPADARDSEFVPYPDHHVYSDAELEGLSRRAAKHGATLVTTEKDWIKIPPGYQKKIKCVPMDIEIENPFWAWLNEQKKG